MWMRQLRGNINQAWVKKLQDARQLLRPRQQTRSASQPLDAGNARLRLCVGRKAVVFSESRADSGLPFQLHFASPRHQRAQQFLPQQLPRSMPGSELPVQGTLHGAPMAIASSPVAGFPVR